MLNLRLDEIPSSQSRKPSRRKTKLTWHTTDIELMGVEIMYTDLKILYLNKAETEFKNKISRQIHRQSFKLLSIGYISGHPFD